MSKKKSRALPRGRREHPQEERIFSTYFLDQMISRGGCFVPLEDFQVLQKKYIKLFKRYKRNA